MIYPLRKRHRAMTYTLAILLPILFMVSLLARQAPPEPNSSIPRLHDSVIGEFASTSGVSGTFAAQPAISYRILGNQAAAIELSASETLRLPELLVYWSPQTRASTLPEDRVLLGSWAVTTTRVFELPTRAVGPLGGITLYSLSQQEVVASTPLN